MSKVETFAKHRMPSSASAYTRFVYLHEYEQLEAKIDEINEVQHNQFKYINELEAENQRLREAEALLNKIIEAYCLMNLREPSKDDYNRLMEQLKIANDSLTEL